MRLTKINIMHDLHLADKILKTAIENAEKNNLKKIKSVSVEIGSIVEHGEKVTPENLQVNFELLAKGTIAEGAQLMVDSREGDTWGIKEIEGKSVS